nr:ion transporter [Bacteroidota bacterium]
MPAPNLFRQKMYEVVFKMDTPAGNRFDIVVIGLILTSVTFVILESVGSISERYEKEFNIIEWGFTILFTLEYILRIYAARDRIKFITSFFGLVDFFAIVPTYLGIFFPGGETLLIIRVLRLLRIFRIFQMGHFVREGAVVASALKASKIKIIIFLSFVLIASVFMGALMYMVEAKFNPAIENIPEGIYWAIVTLTTVGYGDAIPVTDGGKLLAAIVMIMGYAVIAVPTGIV